MSNPVSYFVRATDLAEVITNKLVLANRVELAQDGTTVISDTTATVPALGVSAWGLIRATSATVVASLTSFDPTTLVSSTLTPTLASGEHIRGYFTAITLTSGAVVCHNIHNNETAPVPVIDDVSVTPNVSNDTQLDYNFSIDSAGGFPPPNTEVWRKVGAGAYSLLSTNVDDNGEFSVNDLAVQTGATSVIKYKARYKSALPQYGAFSNEITPAPDLPVVTLGSGTWTHSTLTAATTVTIPAGSFAADFIEIWGFANAAAVVANGALTLLATVHQAIDGATTYVFSKAYAGLDDSSSKTIKFQARYKTAATVPVFGLRSAVQSITAVFP